MAQAGDGKIRSERRRATHRLSKRVTQEEFQEFHIRSAEAGFEDAQDYLSAFIAGDIRLRAASRKDAIKALGELGKIGSNINQLAKAGNEGRIPHLDDRAAVALENATLLIEQLGEKIREALK
jgi:hypothetical protein